MTEQNEANSDRTEANDKQPQTSPTQIAKLVPRLSASGRCVHCGVELPADRRFQCEKCDVAVAAEVQKRQARGIGEAVYFRLKRSGLPKRYFDDLDIDWPVSGDGFYLYGPAGIGKTQAASAWLAREIKAGASGYYVYIPDLFTELSEIYAAEDSRSRADVIERYSTAQRLVLDDIDKVKASHHAGEVLLSILDYRYRNDVTGMIVISNVPIEDLAAPFEQALGSQYSEPLIRRITEMSVPVEMRGANESNDRPIDGSAS